MSQRTIFGGLVALVAMLLVPVAIAWACNPQARIVLDGTTYAPGSQVTVSGSFFRENQKVDLSLSPGGAIGSVTTDGNGTFRQSFRLADDARGAYTVTATAVTPTGTFQAREAFQVERPQAPAQQAPAPQPQAQQPQAQQAPAPQPQAQQPAPAPAPAPSADNGSETFSEPGVFSEPSVVQSRGPREEPTSSNRRGSNNQSAAPGQGGSSSGSSGSGFGGTGFGGSGAGADSSSGSAPDVTRVLGRTVFGGSTASAGPAATATPVGSAAAQSAGRSGSGNVPTVGGRSDSSASPSERTAMGDLWSGFAGGRTPSLAPSAGDGTPADGSGTQLAWGLGLLALGLVGLLSGLAVLEARRRRALS